MEMMSGMMKGMSKANDGYVLMLGKSTVSEKDMKSMRDKMMQMQKKMSELEMKK